MNTECSDNVVFVYYAAGKYVFLDTGKVLLTRFITFGCVIFAGWLTSLNQHAV